MPLGAGTRLKTRMKALATRVTRNRLTFVFFLFGFFHCFAQGIVQAFLFTIDSQYSSFFSTVTNAMHVPPKNHTDLRGYGDNFQLEMCDFIPHDNYNCFTLFDSVKDVHPAKSIEDDAINRGRIVKEIIYHNDINVAVQANTSTNEIMSVTLNSSAGNVTLNPQCSGILLYPTQHMQNSKREDIAFVCLQFWLFGISLMAMFNDSVPHILAGLITRIILTAWSAYALWRSHLQRDVYNRMIEVPGSPCSLEMFSDYFQQRFAYEIIDLVLNFTALTIAAYLSLTLVKLYNTQSFNYVGAPKEIHRIHRYFMAVKVCLQLEAFVLLTASGLWADQLFNTYVKHITNHREIYEALILFYSILLGPWMLTGWYGIRKENRIALAVFIVLGFLFILFSALMFYSAVYRWTFYAWPNFGCFVTASLILLVATFVLGILCRLNFGKGLSQYLHAEAALASMNFAPEVFDRDQDYGDNKTPLEDLKENPVPTYYSYNIPTLKFTDAEDRV